MGIIQALLYVILSAIAPSRHRARSALRFDGDRLVQLSELYRP